MLGTEVQPAVVVVLTEVPGFPLQDALTAASAVLEPRLHPRTQHSPAHPVRRTVSARFPRFRLRLRSPSHVRLYLARSAQNRGETHPLMVNARVWCLESRCWRELNGEQPEERITVSDMVEDPTVARAAALERLYLVFRSYG